MTSSPTCPSRTENGSGRTPSPPRCTPASSSRPSETPSSVSPRPGRRPSRRPRRPHPRRPLRALRRPRCLAPRHRNPTPRRRPRPPPILRLHPRRPVGPRHQRTRPTLLQPPRPDRHRTHPGRPRTRRHRATRATTPTRPERLTGPAGYTRAARRSPPGPTPAGKEPARVNSASYGTGADAAMGRLRPVISAAQSLHHRWALSSCTWTCGGPEASGHKRAGTQGQPGPSGWARS